MLRFDILSPPPVTGGHSPSRHLSPAMSNEQHLDSVSRPWDRLNGASSCPDPLIIESRRALLANRSMDGPRP